MTIEQVPTWVQPSHPAFIAVKTYKSGNFSKYATSATHIPAGTIIANFSTAATPAGDKAYSSLQVSETEHIELNSDLLYANHSCDPNVIFDTTSWTVTAIRDIEEGEPIAFNYLSTEWEMAQAFPCECGSPKCLGEIRGAKYVPTKVLRGYFVNRHIKKMLEQRDQDGAVN
ncbi:hypothetical protein DRE_00104 [Drechslerella stenobrocha 248]|uniref:Post-SET domain-containing protein n=1 Tax=Drechslerella stenobrocha 248 TaxID=1043628 RepID=W7HZ51_9PEZI|nr:hypothetical protein DRE_00104 [Drechslerella stenobrocha 248]